ncbi:MAG: chemotaxis-specific protein-glutamate methyltransferase CheB [Thermoanaerobaculales bacterium]
MKQTRVFIVDDSAVSRMALRQAVEGDGRARVVGEAIDGHQALERIHDAEPDIVLMDIMMAKMDGIEATRALMRSFPRPVLIISDLVGRDCDLNFKALEAGALDLIRKPSALELADEAAVGRLRRKVRLLAGVPVVTRHQRRTRPPRTELRTAIGDGTSIGEVSVVCIGASTGGPAAVLRVLAALNGGSPWPILLVQHTIAGFTAGMVKWLGHASGLEVVVAEDRVRPRPGVIYVAPDDHHLEFRGERMALTVGPPLGGHRPAVDALFDSIADGGAAEGAIAVLMSGMGSDGARGLQRIRRAGGWTIAQDEASSVVYGMPKVAVELEAACEVLSVDGIAARLVQCAT